jgi:AraC-like ligand binding domain
MRASRDQLPILFGADPSAVRGVDWGDLRAIVMSLPAGTDLSPVLKGLPNDRCPCPHWGYVLKGQMRVEYADGQEVIRAGDVFYLPPDHTGVVEEDFECIEFSQPAPHEAVMQVVRRNAAAIAV